MCAVDVSRTQKRLIMIGHSDTTEQWSQTVMLETALSSVIWSVVAISYQK
jgi:hypothetical protein